MTNKLYDDSNWREEYKSYTSNKRELAGQLLCPDYMGEGEL